MSLLMQHDWRGNVRELENAVHRAVILATGDLIRRAHLAGIGDAGPRMDIDIPKTSDELKRLKKAARERSVEEIEKLFVLEALKRNAWNVTRSAEETGMLRANFQALMKKHDISIRTANKNAGEADAGG
jgi:DNA-binding NtrC family response regulator